MRKLFFELVQVSVGQLDGMSRFPEPDEWRKLFELSRRHAIAGICYHGITSLQEHGLVAPQELSRDWLKEVEQTKEMNRGRSRRLIRLQEELRTHHLRSSIITGPGLARFYDRELQMQRYTRSISLYVFGYRNQVDLNQWKDINVHVFTELNAGKANQRNHRFEKWLLLNNDLMFSKVGELIVPSHAMTIILQIVHLYNLFLDRQMRLRDLMDLFFVLRYGDENKNQYQFSERTLEEEIKNLGLTRFTRGIMWLMKEVFNLDAGHLLAEPLEDEGQFLLNKTMSGNFTLQDWWHKLWYYTFQNLT